MISRSPAPARATPPDTGASTRSTPCAASRSAQRSTAAGPTVAMTTTMAPGSSAALAGSSPKSTPSTCSGVATISTRTSAPAAARVIVAAGDTPSSASSSARRGSMSNAVVAYPARATQAAIGAPIAPRPIHPTRSIRSPSWSWSLRSGRTGAPASRRRPGPWRRPAGPGAGGCRHCRPRRVRRGMPASAPR